MTSIESLDFRSLTFRNIPQILSSTQNEHTDSSSHTNKFTNIQINFLLLFFPLVTGLDGLDSQSIDHLRAAAVEKIFADQTCSTQHLGRWADPHNLRQFYECAVNMDSLPECDDVSPAVSRQIMQDFSVVSNAKEGLLLLNKLFFKITSIHLLIFWIISINLEFEQIKLQYNIHRCL